jgi:hypothetical protein
VTAWLVGLALTSPCWVVIGYLLWTWTSRADPLAEHDAELLRLLDGLKRPSSPPSDFGASK